MEDKFLPIGTVVTLKGGTRKLMIMSYCVMPEGKGYDKNGEVDVKDKMFDYGACFYPEGMLTSDQMFAFNHEQIDKINFKGYETEEQKAISEVLKGGLEEMNNEEEESQE